MAVGHLLCSSALRIRPARALGASVLKLEDLLQPSKEPRFGPLCQQAGAHNTWSKTPWPGASQ